MKTANKSILCFGQLPHFYYFLNAVLILLLSKKLFIMISTQLSMAGYKSEIRRITNSHLMGKTGLASRSWENLDKLGPNSLLIHSYIMRLLRGYITRHLGR